MILLATLFGQFPFLETLFADSAYQGPIFADALAEILPYLQIVNRPDQTKGFVQLPKRWIVELQRFIFWRFWRDVLDRKRSKRLVEVTEP